MTKVVFISSILYLYIYILFITILLNPFIQSNVINNQVSMESNENLFCNVKNNEIFII